MTLKKNSTCLLHVLCHFNLCSSFRSHLWIQTGDTAQKCTNWGKLFNLWPWPLTSDLDLLQGHHCGQGQWLLKMLWCYDDWDIVKREWHTDRRIGLFIERKSQVEADIYEFMWRCPMMLMLTSPLFESSSTYGYTPAWPILITITQVEFMIVMKNSD